MVSPSLAPASFRVPSIYSVGWCCPNQESRLPSEPQEIFLDTGCGWSGSQLTNFNLYVILQVVVVLLCTPPGACSAHTP